ncbi:hypothetical protein JCM12141A_08330 [Mycolicibacterium hodleri]
MVRNGSKYFKNPNMNMNTPRNIELFLNVVLSCGRFTGSSQLVGDASAWSRRPSGQVADHTWEIMLAEKWTDNSNSDTVRPWRQREVVLRRG